MYRACFMPPDSPHLCTFNELFYICLWWGLVSAISVCEPFLQIFCCVARTRPLAGILGMRAASPVRAVPPCMQELCRNSALCAGAGCAEKRWNPLCGSRIPAKFQHACLKDAMLAQNFNPHTSTLTKLTDCALLIDAVWKPQSHLAPPPQPRSPQPKPCPHIPPLPHRTCPRCAVPRSASARATQCICSALTTKPKKALSQLWGKATAAPPPLRPNGTTWQNW
jgi:hypothetical protein